MRGTVERWIASALLVATALCAAWDVRAIASRLRHPPAAAIHPRALHGPYADVLERTRRRVPEDVPVLALWDHQPHVFAYYLAPRPVFASPELTSRRPALVRERAARRGIRWLVGRDLVHLPDPRRAPAP